MCLRIHPKACARSGSISRRGSAATAASTVQSFTADLKRMFAIHDTAWTQQAVIQGLLHLYRKGKRRTAMTARDNPESKSRRSARRSAQLLFGDYPRQSTC